MEKKTSKWMSIDKVLNPIDDIEGPLQVKKRKEMILWWLEYKDSGITLKRAKKE